MLCRHHRAGPPGSLSGPGGARGRSVGYHGCRLQVRGDISRSGASGRVPRESQWAGRGAGPVRWLPRLQVAGTGAVLSAERSRCRLPEACRELPPPASFGGLLYSHHDRKIQFGDLETYLTAATFRICLLYSSICGIGSGCIGPWLTIMEGLATLPVTRAARSVRLHHHGAAQALEDVLSYPGKT